MLLVLNIPVFWIYQGSEYAKVLNMPSFWISQCFEYARVTQCSEYAWIISEYAKLCLIFVKNSLNLKYFAVLFYGICIDFDFTKELFKYNIHFIIMFRFFGNEMFVTSLEK